MDAALELAFERDGWFHSNCPDCNNPVLEFSGDSDRGLTRIDCGECRARWERRTVRSAIELFAAQLASAVMSADDDRARSMWRALHTAWEHGLGLVETTRHWYQTHSGDLSDDDETPF